MAQCGSAGLFWDLVPLFLMPDLLKVGVLGRQGDSEPLLETLLSLLPLLFIQSRAGGRDQS